MEFLTSEATFCSIPKTKKHAERSPLFVTKSSFPRVRSAGCDLPPNPTSGITQGACEISSGSMIIKALSSVRRAGW